MKDEIFIGKTLYCKNGEICVIDSIEEKNININYKGKIYKRSKTIIGDKLYLSPVKIQNEEKTDNTHTCSNCMKQKSEECYGSVEICKDFIYCPNLENEKKYWPEYGDATSFKAYAKRK